MADNNLWEQILAEIELEVSRAEFSSFFVDTKLAQKNNGVMVITCRNQAERRWLEQNYFSLVSRLLKEKTGKKPVLQFKIDTQSKVEQKKEIGPLFSPSTNFVGLDPLCTMDNFAVSTSNQLAYAAAQAVITKPGKAYNPLFLWGGVGVGKTHLMQAIGHEIIKRDADARVVFCMGEEFTNEIIEAIRNKSTAAFKRKYRKAQLLLLDDVQFIAGKVKVQEEFFHTFVAIKREGGQVVLTSDRPPQEMLELEARLRSRFEAGLIADISEPNFELRSAIVLIKARQRGKNIPMEVARLLAENIKDTRRLEGALMRLLTEAQIETKELDLEFAQDKLGTAIADGPPRPLLSVSDTIKLVASRFNVSVTDLKGKKRSRPVAVPRQITMYLLRKELGLSLQDVGTFLGGRDHTTIMHGVAKVEDELLNDSGWGGEIRGIKNELWGKTT